MGEILFRTKLSEEMFEGLRPWLNRVPGRLMHTTILGCGVFGSVSGSSAATCATIAKVALPELKRRGYNEKLAIGSLATAGTLGILIPPSITWWCTRWPPTPRSSVSSWPASCRAFC
ncbi:TRAP transporter large permease subunit [Variovorax sp. V512]|uniref:TRAP transporter large permease subunit n=1 Tax=Variovorax sp. V512 TaxID=3064160 RepID=UPI0032E6C152